MRQGERERERESGRELVRDGELEEGEEEMIEDGNEIWRDRGGTACVS